MKIFSGLLIILISITLAACSSVSSKSEGSILNENMEFAFRSSAVPAVQTANRVDTVKSERRIVNYDDIRAVWLSYIDLASMLTGKTEQDFSDAFDKACKNICELGCNTIYVHVRPFGDAIYRSELYPTSRYITGHSGKNGDFDPLEIMVEKAHSYKLSIHGWINPLRLESKDQFDLYDGSFMTKQWFENNNGYVCEVTGDKHLWLNPGYSEVRQLIADGAAEIVRKYEVDGIHYDDYFYPTTAESFDEACFSSFGKNKSLSIWRLDNINDMVSRIYRSVKAVDSELIVGVSPQGNLDNNYRYMYADVKKWGSQQGYVDYICPQIYFGYNNPVKPFLNTLKEWEQIVTEPKVALCVGLAVYKIAGSETEFVQTNGIIANQIKDIYGSHICKGFSLYAYNNLFSSNERASSELDSIKTELKKHSKD